MKSDEQWADGSVSCCVWCDCRLWRGSHLWREAVSARVHQPGRHRLHLLLQTWLRSEPRQHLQLPWYTHTYTLRKSLSIAEWQKTLKLSGFLLFSQSFFFLADIDECEQYGICPQICRNTKGSYSCNCAPGYRQVGDGKMCEAEGETGSTS